MTAPNFDGTNTPQPVKLSPGSASTEMVDLFDIDGTMYQIPAKPRLNVVLKFMWQSKTVGLEVAASEMLMTLLGEEAFQALMNYEDLTAEDLSAVFEAAQKIALGSLVQVDAGEGSRGSKK